MDLNAESLPVRERVIKACATSGLTMLSLDLMNSILKPVNDTWSESNLPSVAAYGSVLNGLRKLGKTNEMKFLLKNLVEIVSYLRISNHDDDELSGTIENIDTEKTKPLTLSEKTELNGIITKPSINVVAFNSYLAALCDNVISPYDKQQMVRGRRRPSDRRYVLTSDFFLNEALSHIIDPSLTQEKYCLDKKPDLFSYNTVLAAAARAGDHTAVKVVFKVFKEQQKEDETLVEDIFTYNALLRDAVQKSEQGSQIFDYEAHSTIVEGADANFTSVAEVDALQLIDEILSHPTLKPDRYTIDLALLPLTRNGRIGDLIKMLREYRCSCGDQERDRREMSDAFSAFLFTLVKGDEVSTGHSILNTFLLEDDKSGKSRPFPVMAKHFNILIEGYRRMKESSDLKVSLETNLTAQSLVTEQNQSSHAKIQAEQLVETMINLNIRPDSYTLTSLLAIQSSSAEVTAVWKRFVQEFKVKMTSPTYHSLITVYGKVNDPSRACIVFDAMPEGLERGKQIVRTTKSWNTIQAVFADESNCLLSLNAEGLDDCHEILSMIAENEKRKDNQQQLEMESSTAIKITDKIDGMVCTEASRTLLSIMNESNDSYSERIPPANSQTYCYTATSLSHVPYPNATEAMSLFREAIDNSIPADGRFVNAVIRCFGSDIDAALNAWKQEIGKAVIKYNEERKGKSKNQNFMAAFHGLYSVCGQAGRPDIAVRLVYAMAKQGLTVTETALQCYEAGKKRQEMILMNENNTDVALVKKKSKLGRAISKMYENILVVECSKYSERDKRRSGERRVRIIL